MKKLDQINKDLSYILDQSKSYDEIEFFLKEHLFKDLKLSYCKDQNNVFFVFQDVLFNIDLKEKEIIEYNLFKDNKFSYQIYRDAFKTYYIGKTISNNFFKLFLNNQSIKIYSDTFYTKDEIIKNLFKLKAKIEILIN